MGEAIKVDDFVTLREDRAAPSYAGVVGRVVDPGYPPPGPTKIYVRYEEGYEL